MDENAVTTAEALRRRPPGGNRLPVDRPPSPVRSYGADVDASVLAGAGGAAFTAVVLGQMANAWACRSATRPFWRLGARSNLLLVWAIGVELLLLATMLGVPALADLLGQRPPPLVGLGIAIAAVPAVLLADTGHKLLRSALRSGPAHVPVAGDA
jgi:hypothetical protein